MDEQTMQQTQENSVDEEVAALPEDVPETADEPAQEEPEIGLTSDGEVKFRDGFFGDYGKKEDSGNGDQAGTDGGDDEHPPAAESNVDGAQRLYSPEELRTTPFEQWDRARLPKEIAAYYDAVSAQLTARQKAAEVKNAPLPPILGDAPKPYTPKELVEDANKLAMEKLGITDAMDFDPEYDAEQRAAVDLAKAELIQRRNYDMASYQQRAQEFSELRDFNARLVSSPDFASFDKWYGQTLKKVGKTNEQVQAGLYEIARTHGGRAVIQQLQTWYRMFRDETAAAQQQAAQVKQTPRVKRQPPKLESTQGGSTGGRRTYNMREFSQLDDDAQARALIDMGLV